MPFSAPAAVNLLSRSLIKNLLGDLGERADHIRCERHYNHWSAAVIAYPHPIGILHEYQHVA
jgi:hypothetical protein